MFSNASGSQIIFTFEITHDYFDIEKSNVIMILNFTMIHNNDSQ